MRFQFIKSFKQTLSKIFQIPIPKYRTEPPAHIPSTFHLPLPQIQNESLKLAALLHPSYPDHGQKIKNSLPTNFYRLAFRGDAALNYNVAKYLLREFPEAQQGRLTELRAEIVSRKNLAEYCRRTGLDECILIQEGPGKLRNNESVLAESMEAYIGALDLELIEREKRREKSAIDEITQQQRMSQEIFDESFTTLVNMTEQLSIEKQSENDFPRNITSQVLGNLVESIRHQDPTIRSRIEAVVNNKKSSSSTTTIKSKRHPRLLRRFDATMTQIRISICENFKFFYHVRLNRSYCTNTEFNLRIVAYELLALKQPNVPVSATVLKDMENTIGK
ncbi:10442_t:CDS:2 [Ambispora gerdemannii]|uniref:10442_t:CDS:1 n=1 Tax=Ambispora gerdemannii TaxID=144530 RepID=A0A9N9CEK6_9GLOM|nr:10442_t:CDS:2 [Ambispora gerdemannii]